jgi:chitin synthase
LLGIPDIHRHYFNGPATYSSEEILDRNLDSLNPDFVSLLRGSIAGAADGAEGAGSINPFVKGLFSGKVITTHAHPKDEDTIVSAQQTVKPIGALSTCCKGTIKRLPEFRIHGSDVTVPVSDPSEFG